MASDNNLLNLKEMIQGTDAKKLAEELKLDEDVVRKVLDAALVSIQAGDARQGSQGSTSANTTTAAAAAVPTSTATATATAAESTHPASTTTKPTTTLPKPAIELLKNIQNFPAVPALSAVLHAAITKIKKDAPRQDRSGLIVHHKDMKKLEAIAKDLDTKAMEIFKAVLGRPPLYDVPLPGHPPPKNPAPPPPGHTARVAGKGAGVSQAVQGVQRAPMTSTPASLSTGLPPPHLRPGFQWITPPANTLGTPAPSTGQQPVHSRPGTPSGAPPLKRPRLDAIQSAAAAAAATAGRRAFQPPPPPASHTQLANLAGANTVPGSQNLVSRPLGPGPYPAPPRGQSGATGSKVKKAREGKKTKEKIQLPPLGKTDVGEGGGAEKEGELGARKFPSIGNLLGHGGGDGGGISADTSAGAGAAGAADDKAKKKGKSAAIEGIKDGEFVGAGAGPDDGDDNDKKKHGADDGNGGYGDSDVHVKKEKDGSD